MKITAQEEYGVRLLLRVARCRDRNGMSIPQLSEAEGITAAYAAKIARKLRMEGYLNSTPGNKGGYVLARPAAAINMNEVLKTLGGPLFNKSFCGGHAGALKLCTNSVDCSVRSLWQIIQLSVDQLLDKVTLADLISPEERSENLLADLLEQSFRNVSVSREAV